MIFDIYGYINPNEECFVELVKFAHEKASMILPATTQEIGVPMEWIMHNIVSELFALSLQHIVTKDVEGDVKWGEQSLRHNFQEWRKNNNKDESLKSVAEYYNDVIEGNGGEEFFIFLDIEAEEELDNKVEACLTTLGLKFSTREKVLR
jgi:hypothetical protein